MKDADKNEPKEDFKMPTAVMEAINEQINQKDEIELAQEQRLAKLRALLKSHDEEAIEAERKAIMKVLKSAGILNQNGNLSKNYKT